MNKKLIIILSCIGVAAAAIIVSVVLFMGKGQDAYRIIKIFEVEGDATVNRDSTGDITPYNNMLLESGDNVFLATGDMTLKMDEDKFAYVEEDTEFSIVAEGTAENSKTTIQLKKGAITNEIQNKLAEGATYEVNTPNSTMAVRGTVFRVEVYTDKDGVSYTKVSVFNGKVATRLQYADGTTSDEEVFVEAGKQVIIYDDEETTDYLGGVTEIPYSELPQEVKDLVEEVLGFSPDGTTTVESDDTTKETEEEEDAEEAEEEEELEEDDSDTEDESDEEKKTSSKTKKKASSTETATNSTAPNSAATDTTTQDTTQDTTTGTYTVTFQYQGATFGTQTVNAGEKASEPTLMPAASGSWDFDFSTAINQDTVIQWK